MEQYFQFSNDMHEDWNALCKIWKQSDKVMSGEVGPTWIMPPQHKVCLEFADHYTDSKDFIASKLADNDPLIAAYAFKILIRLDSFFRNDIPNEVFNRKEKITIHIHSFTETKTLNEYFDEYFKIDEPIQQNDKRSLSWQDNELADYLNAIKE